MGFGQGSGRHYLKPVTTQSAFAAYEALRARLPPVRRSAACSRLPCLDDISDRFDVFLLDAFGVLNIGETAISGVPARVAGLQRAGKRVLVVTNAASYSRAGLLQKYKRLGYNFAPEDVISSRLALLDALKNEPARRWGLMAPETLGLDHLGVTLLAEDPDKYDAVDGFLMVGSGEWTDARQALLETSLAQNPRPVLVGNPDIIAPRETGFSVEPGWYAHQLADRIPAIRPRFFGKPFQNIYDLVFDHLRPNIDKSRILMVGDSLHTDILGGQIAGIQTALIAGYGFFGGTPVDPAIAQSGIQPDFILERP